LRRNGTRFNHLKVLCGAEPGSQRTVVNLQTRRESAGGLTLTLRDLCRRRKGPEFMPGHFLS
jgi:hypothetical protein